MFMHFRRPPRPSQWQPGALAGPEPSLTLREWQVGALLCSLSDLVQKALLDWLIRPTDLYRWPPPDRLEHRRASFGEEELRGLSGEELAGLLREELRVIRQTLDVPPPVMSGLIQNGLLAAHGTRLRQLERRLRPGRAAREIERMIA